MTKPSFFNNNNGANLPREIFFDIFKEVANIDPIDAKNLFLVCRHWNLLLKSDLFIPLQIRERAKIANRFNKYKSTLKKLDPNIDVHIQKLTDDILKENYRSVHFDCIIDHVLLESFDIKSKINGLPPKPNYVKELTENFKKSDLVKNFKLYGKEDRQTIFSLLELNALSSKINYSANSEALLNFNLKNTNIILANEIVPYKGSTWFKIKEAICSQLVLVAVTGLPLGLVFIIAGFIFLDASPKFSVTLLTTGAIFMSIGSAALATEIIRTITNRNNEKKQDYHTSDYFLNNGVHIDPLNEQSNNNNLPQLSPV